MKIKKFIIFVAVLMLSILGVNNSAFGVRLYDVDFGSPPHTVGQPPAIGTALPPRNTPGEIIFEGPEVVASLGALNNQPCKFVVPKGESSKLAQLGFGVLPSDGFPYLYQRYIIEMDILIESLIYNPSGNSFTILLDTPIVRRIDFLPDGTIEVALPAVGDTTIGQYSIGLVTTLRIDVDLRTETWEVYLNGDNVYSDEFFANELHEVRISLRDFDYEGNVAAVDNIRIYGFPVPVTTGETHFSVLNYNVSGIGAPSTNGREALQRIVDYFDPDIIIFQEAKGTTYPDDFLLTNGDYEGYYSSSDGAQNSRMIMSKFDIIDSSVQEYSLGGGSLRTLFTATIDVPRARDVDIFTAHWHASSAAVRHYESAASVALITAHQTADPDSHFIYAGDLNEEDTSYRIRNLLSPSVGLNLSTPVDLNNDSNATINSDPNKGTYLDRRIDYVLLSNSLVSSLVNERILNTWTYTPWTIPASLHLTDTIKASDHLPICAYFEVPNFGIGDLDGDKYVNFIDMAMFAPHWQKMACGECDGADLTGDGQVNAEDLREFALKWLECYHEPASICWE